MESSYVGSFRMVQAVTQMWGKIELQGGQRIFCSRSLSSNSPSIYLRGSMAKRKTSVRSCGFKPPVELF